MKDKILSLFTNPSEMTPEQIVLNIGIAAVLGFFIFISSSFIYSICNNGIRNRYSIYIIIPLKYM